MTAAPDPMASLGEALARGDLVAARAAYSQLLERQALVDGSADLTHLGRMLDLGQAAAELVHELRQPLSGVKSLAQMIALKPGDAASVAKRIAPIVENAERMTAYVERLGSYSRGGSRPREACDLNAAIEAAALLLRLDKKTAIRVERDLQPELPSVQADPIGLQQIFINLLANARQALPQEGGCISVRTRCTNGFVEAVVADDGPGVPPEVRDRMFEPFATTKSEGTGLGLHISRRIAEEHGGTLELVDSKAGAVFALRVPIAVGGT